MDYLSRVVEVANEAANYSAYLASQPRGRAGDLGYTSHRMKFDNLRSMLDPIAVKIAVFGSNRLVDDTRTVGNTLVAIQGEWEKITSYLIEAEGFTDAEFNVLTARIESFSDFVHGQLLGDVRTELS